MSIVEILEVSVNQENMPYFWGFSLDTPKTGQTFDVYTIVFRGWVLGRISPARAVRLWYCHQPREIIREVPVDIIRTDVAEHYADVPNSERNAFLIILSVIGLPLETELALYAILEDGNVLNLANIRLRHQPLITYYQPRIQPLIVNSLGRSGSTWLMYLLSKHPNVIIDGQYPFESHASKYWLYTLLKFVAESPNYLNVTASQDEFFTLVMQWAGANFYGKAAISTEWFGHTHIEQLATFCQQSIDSFYAQTAVRHGCVMNLEDGHYSKRTYIRNWMNGIVQKVLNRSNHTTSPSLYFAEKFGPGYSARIFYELYPQTKEIFLVRDFRDMLCSSLSFNKKLGTDGFGLSAHQLEDDMVRVTQFRAQCLLMTWQRRSQQAYLVRYEDLVLNPIPTLQGIFDYLHLEHNPSMIDSFLEKSLEDNSTLRNHQTTSHPKNSIGRWQHDLSHSLKELCQQELAEELKAFGYTELAQK
ncbi:MAG: hypothetical protein BWK79_15340 [Beggiatoa sp. IS2]|nr:MAG: hypothetical protein BWK79_15340 [Beggiatoa sp. IS2]